MSVWFNYELNEHTALDAAFTGHLWVLDVLLEVLGKLGNAAREVREEVRDAAYAETK